jgi:hypothetical protein
MGVSGCKVRFPPKLSSPGFSRFLAFLLDEVSKIARNVLCHDAANREVTRVSHGPLTRSTRDVNYATTRRAPGARADRLDT